MSASNWAVCPRCVKRHVATLDTLRAEVEAAYGTVSVGEFDRMREKLAEALRAPAPSTLREDYEFYGAEGGTVVAEYGCTCTKCGLTSDFTYRHELDV